MPCAELYHRIFIEEGTRPKQISEGAYAAAEEARKEKERAGRGDRKLWGETAPLGLKLQVVKTQRNGDCFFDALCKAYVQVAQAARNREVEQLGGPSDGAAAGASATEAVYRCPAMWAAAFPEEAAASGGAPPPPSVPLTVKELRQVVACHFPEEAWIIGQAVGGDSFAFIVEHDLELTKANVAALADDAADKAYWADESAIAVLQRYLSARLLIFNPAAGDGYRCACSADIQERGPHGLSYIMLRHSHRASKLQHYELYVLPGSRRAVFDEASLAAGVKRAFARVCPDATPAWASAADAEPGAEEEPIVLA